MAPSVAVSAAAISADIEWHESACRTPTAAECRIPEPNTCPPAPRKLRNDGGGDNDWRRHVPPAAGAKFFFPTAVDLEKIFDVYRVR